MSKADIASKNILINGGFTLFQRNGSSVNLSTTPTYVGADRFRLSYSGTVTGTPTSTKSTDVPNNKTRNSLKLISQRNASDSSVICAQRVESLNASESVGEVVSKSGWCKSPTATSVTLIIRVPTLQDNYTSSYVAHTQTVSVVADNTWQLFKFEAITLPDVSNGFEVEISLNSPVGTDAAPVEHLLSQLKLNHGYKASGFSRAGRNVQEEILLCQRYYEKSSSLDVAVTAGETLTSHYFLQLSGGQAFAVAFKAIKRAIPVCQYVSTSGAVGSMRNESSSVDTAQTPQRVSQTGFSMYNGTGAGGVIWAFHWYADSEI